jgi:DnaK suppressor protein
MDAMQVQAMAVAQQARRDREKAAIATALIRIDDDEFGGCLNCGDEIAEQRLRLNPTVATCIACARGE